MTTADPQTPGPAHPPGAGAGPRVPAPPDPAAGGAGDPANTARCTSCQAEIVWAETTAGRRMPLDPDPVPAGNVALTPRQALDEAPALPLATVNPPSTLGGPRYVSHFATCPQAGAHRRPRR